MPRPNWDPTKPLDSDQVSAFPALHRGDKTTLKDILGTLGPFGSTTTTWRQVQVGDDTWLVQNLYFDGTNWNRDDTTKASIALGLGANGTVTVHKVAAGANPVGASLPAPVVTLDATSLVAALVAGTDPGGTESLRAGSARLNAPVLLGSVPQFTMAADPTAALQVATKQYADTKVSRTGDSMSGALVVGTDPGGTELLRAQSLRAGSGRIGSWRILGVIQPTSNVTSVQFSGLSLSPPVVLRLVMVVRNTTSSRALLQLRVNGETNSNDWAYQNILGFGTTVSAVRYADYSEIAWASAGSTGTASCIIGVGPSGAVIANSISSDSNGTDVPILNTYSTMKNTTITSLSSIEIVSLATGGIASGSVFYLEYLAP